MIDVIKEKLNPFTGEYRRVNKKPKDLQYWVFFYIKNFLWNKKNKF